MSVSDKLTSAFQTRGFKIPRYFLVIETISIFSYVFYGLAPLFFPNAFDWITYKEAWFYLWGFVFILNLITGISLSLFKRDWIFSATNHIHAVFHLSIIYITGGIESPFVLMLVIPLLISAMYLSATEIAVSGALIAIAFSSFILFPFDQIQDPNLISKLIVQVVTYATIVYLMYHVIRETLHQKYERLRAEQTVSEQAELDKVKSKFVTIASHQLRTPLTGIRWGLSNLKEQENLTPEAREIIDTSYARIVTAIDIVNDMLKTAEHSDVNTILEKKPIDVSALVKEILTEHAYLVQKNNVKVIFDENSSHIVPGEQGMIKIALSSIIDNAISYAPNQSVHIDIHPKGKSLFIFISDTGIGIPAEDQKQIFERFYRAKNAINLDPNRSGSGLYTAQQIVKMHNGTIELTSEEGKGTTVTITLPL